MRHGRHVLPGFLGPSCISETPDDPVVSGGHLTSKATESLRFQYLGYKQLHTYTPLLQSYGLHQTQFCLQHIDKHELQEVFIVSKLWHSFYHDKNCNVKLVVYSTQATTGTTVTSTGQLS